MKKSKKSQGNVIAVILIVLLCLFVILILWRVIFPMTQSTKEESQIRQELSKTQLGINEVSGDTVNPGGKLDITISRGSGELELENMTKKETKIEKLQEVDIISALDVSGSMNQAAGPSPDYYNCTAKEQTPPFRTYINDCCFVNNCSTPAGCAKCNKGVFSNGICYMTRYVNYCCLISGDNCKSSETCNYCINFTKGLYPKEYPNDGSYHYTYCYASGPNAYNSSGYVGAPCRWSKDACENVCKGEWALINDGTYYQNCKAVPGKGCCAYYNCSTQTGCESCYGGIFNSATNTCNFTGKFIPPCCQGKNCPGNQTQCLSCGFSWPNEHFDCVIEGRLNDYFNCVYPTETTTFDGWKNVCEIQCDGNFNIVTKLNFTVGTFISDQGLIDSIILNTKNKLGFVTYGDNIKDKISPLNDISQLKSFMISLYPVGSNTNICQALNQSIELLKNPALVGKVKAIILMTDGKLNVFCNGSLVYTSLQTQANNQAIDMARLANTAYGIKVYTIGIGDKSLLDELTLKAIAIAGSGNYSYANVTQLKKIYIQMIDEITTETVAYYKNIQIWNTIRFIISNDTSTYTYDMPKDTEILLPLETKTYTIDTGPMVNINKIDVYIVVHTEDGKEISELVSTWTPETEEGSDYLSSY